MWAVRFKSDKQFSVLAVTYGALVTGTGSAAPLPHDPLPHDSITSTHTRKLLQLARTSGTCRTVSLDIGIAAACKQAQDIADMAERFLLISFLSAAPARVAAQLPRLAAFPSGVLTGPVVGSDSCTTLSQHHTTPQPAQLSRCPSPHLYRITLPYLLQQLPSWLQPSFRSMWPGSNPTHLCTHTRAQRGDSMKPLKQGQSRVCRDC